MHAISSDIQVKEAHCNLSNVNYAQVTLHHPLMATCSTTGMPTDLSITYMSVALILHTVYTLSQQLSHLKPECRCVHVLMQSMLATSSQGHMPEIPAIH